MAIRIGIFLFFLFSFLTAYPQNNHTISGYVSDENGEMLIGVYVFLPNTNIGTVTNAYGFYSLTIREGNYTLRYSFVGFQNRDIEVELNTSMNLNVILMTASRELEEVVVTAEREDENVRDITMSNVRLPARTIRKIPNLLGEVDIIRSIQLLPGVQSSVEGSSGFYVRGGNADQNLILLDGAVVYNPSHLFGFFSIFNGDAVKNVELYKGGIPAEYGGRLSSVLDVRMNEGNTQKIKGSAGVGVLSSRFTLEGPLIKDKLSFIVTGRRTYADLFLPFSKDSVARDSKIFFYDLNTKLNYQINQNNRVFLSGYFGRDVNVFGNIFEMNFGNATGTLRWNHIYNGKLFSNLTLLYSDFTYNLGVPEGILSFRVLSHIIDYSLSNDYTWYINPSNTLKFGFQTTYHTIRPGTVQSEGTASILSDTKFPENHAIESAVFLSNEQKLGQRLTLLYGLRLSLFQNIGASTLYHYDENYELTDSTKYGAGDVFNTFMSLEPRLNLNYQLSERSSLKLSYNRTTQYLHLASNSTATFPLDMWFMSNPNLKPQKADQVALGYFRNFSNNTIEASLEAFYKHTTNAIDFKDHAQLAPQRYLEGELRIGTAYSAGIEFLLRKQSGKLTGWLSYAYIRTFREITDINNGRPFPPPYDKPHNISFLLNYAFSEKIDVGVNWVYSSAIPVTLPTSGFYYDNVWVPVYSERGGTRIPGTEYHRLDLSVNYYFNISRFPANVNFSVFNAYNRHNAFAIYFRDKEPDVDGRQEVESVKLYLFPVVPSVTFNISF